jgi:DNA-binding response OmpR family regulator
MSSPGPAAPARILLVDDEPDMVHATALRLRRAGYEVLTAFDGATGLRLAESERPDLIILDIRMPSSSGFSVCEQLNSKGTPRPPVIFLTGDLTVHAAVRARELGAAYLSKPYDPVELLETVASLLQTSRPATG